MSKGASVCAPHSRPFTHFCTCQSLTFICVACASAHPAPSHTVFPIAQITLFQALDQDKAQLQARNRAVEACQAYFDQCVAAVSVRCEEEKASLAELVRDYTRSLVRRAQERTSLLESLKSEVVRYGVELSPALSPLAKETLAAWDTLRDCSIPPSLEETALRYLSSLLRSEADCSQEFAEVVSKPAKQRSSRAFASFLSPHTQAALAKLGPYSRSSPACIVVLQEEREYDGGVYEGEWNERKQRHGFGRQVWPGGNLYEGMWRQDKQQGRGRLVWGDDGTVYDGEFVENRREGFGVYMYPDGDVYSGGWVNDQRCGFGCVQFSPLKESLCYFGEFSGGQRHGRGALFWRDGGVYVGEWREDKRHGNGLQSWPSGRVYLGGYLESKFHGAGCDLAASGAVFKGIWLNGKKQVS